MTTSPTLSLSRERLLLVDPVNSSAITKQLVALVVGHELAHQWFGNLVSSCVCSPYHCGYVEIVDNTDEFVCVCVS